MTPTQFIELMEALARLERDIHRLIHAICEKGNVNMDHWEEEHPDS